MHPPLAHSLRRRTRAEEAAREHTARLAHCTGAQRAGPRATRLGSTTPAACAWNHAPAASNRRGHAARSITKAARGRLGHAPFRTPGHPSLLKPPATPPPRAARFYEEPQYRKNLVLHYGDLSDSTGLVRIVQLVQPDEIYNLGAQSHVAVSFESPEYTADVDGIGALRLLDAIRICGLEKKTKFYQASTSELYGKVQEVPQRITTPFYPRSPYAVAKLYAFWITVNYREAYGIFACNGVLFNHGKCVCVMCLWCFGGLHGRIAPGSHASRRGACGTRADNSRGTCPPPPAESPLRGETFVTRKITRGLSRIKVRAAATEAGGGGTALASTCSAEAAGWAPAGSARAAGRCCSPSRRRRRCASLRRWGCSSAFTWATSTPSATGATRATTSRCSGS